MGALTFIYSCQHGRMVYFESLAKQGFQNKSRLSSKLPAPNCFVQENFMTIHTLAFKRQRFVQVKTLVANKDAVRPKKVFLLFCCSNNWNLITYPTPNFSI